MAPGFPATPTTPCVLTIRNVVTTLRLTLWEGPVNRRLKRAGVFFAIVVAAAQLIRPDHTNPLTDPRRTIQAQMPAVGAILDRSCRDCHSNATVWPAAAQIAPLSWLMARGVSEGRKAVNFSEWTAYRPDVQRLLLSASCDDAKAGKMPGPYTWVRSETKLSAEDIETICAAARNADAHSVQVAQ